MTKRFGFTLAEVLITLGIIGVVAAMTMPTLINQTNGAQYKAAYKKALSAISQAVTLNVALEDESFAEVVKGKAGEKSGYTGTEGDPTSGTTLAMLLDSRMNIVDVKGKTTSEDKTTYAYDGFPSTVNTGMCLKSGTTNEYTACTGESTDGTSKTISPDTALFFNDGSMFAYESSNATSCTQAAADKTNNKICYGVIDVNGAKGPNKVVKCDNGKEVSASCTVSKPTDIYPVAFYDQTIVPASSAASAVLYGK